MLLFALFWFSLFTCFYCGEGKKIVYFVRPKKADMIEHSFQLEGIEPTEFYGVRNSKMELIRSLCPKVLVVARGHIIKVKGEEHEVGEFIRKFQLLIEHYYHFNALSDETIHQIMMDDISIIDQSIQLNSDVLLFNNTGKPIRPRTPNQQKLVDGCKKEDLIFAIGP